MWFGSGMAVAVASSCSYNLTPILGTSISTGASIKKKKFFFLVKKNEKCIQFSILVNFREKIEFLSLTSRAKLTVHLLFCLKKL